MAVIKTDQMFGIDASSAQFTQQGTPDTSNAEMIKFIGGEAVKAFKGSKIAKAREEGKTLLEEFHGNERLATLRARQIEIGREEDALITGGSVQPDDVTMTENELRILKNEKNKLKLEMDAVSQNLISEVTFRVRAEMRFNQLVAQSPGLREELAKAFGESLGIGDPRGQISKVTQAARKTAASLQDKRDQMQLTAIQKRGLWDNNLTDDELIAKFGESTAQQLFTLSRADEALKLYELTGQFNKGNTIQLMRDLESDWVSKIGQFADRSIFDMDLETLRGLSDEDKRDYLTQATETRIFIKNQVNRMSAGDPKIATPFLKRVDEYYELVTDLISGKGDEAALTIKKTLLDAQLQIRITQAASILATEHPAIMTIAGLAHMVPIQNYLEVFSTLSTAITKALVGKRNNYNDVDSDDPEEAAKVQPFIQSTLANLRAFYKENTEKLTPVEVEAMTNGLLAAANTDPVSLNDKTRQQIMATVATEGYLNTVAKRHPIKARKIANGVIEHQDVMGSTWQNHLRSVVAASDLSRSGHLTAKDFHLEKSDDGSWDILMNTSAIADLSKGATAVSDSAKGREASRTKLLAESRKADVEEALLYYSRELNEKNLSLIPDMVNAMIVISGKEKSAVIRVSQSLGLSLGDTAPQVESTTPKPVLKNKEQPQQQKLGDGVYNINGVLFQVSGDEIVKIDE